MLPDKLSPTKTRSLHRQQSVYESVSNLIPAGHEKSFKQALYTSLALLVSALMIMVAACTYFVLQLFIKPLLWAVLCGSFLFPFKYALQAAISTWLTETWNKGIPLIISTSILPLFIFAKFSEWLGSLVVNNWKMVTIFITGLVFLYFLKYVGLLNWILSGASATFQWHWLMLYYITSFSSQYSGYILAALGLYLISSFILKFKMSSPVSIAMWIFAFMYVCGSFQLPILIVLSVLFIMGVLMSDDAEEETGEASAASNEDPREVKASRSQIVFNSTSAKYFNYLFVIFAIIVTWLHIWILLIMLVPLLFWFCKNLFFHPQTFEIVDKICLGVFHKNKNQVQVEGKRIFLKYQHVVFPEPLPSLLQILKKGDQHMHSLIMSYLPTVTSILIILLLFSNAIFMLVFVLAKIQQETVVVVQISSDLINQTVIQHPEYKAWLPDNETVHKSVDSFVDIVYIQGREWLSQKLQGDKVDANVNSSKVEKQVLKLWDQFYQGYFTERSHLFTRRNISLNITENTGIFHSLLDLLDMTEVLGWLQENVSALVSLGETLLVLLQSNVTLIMSIFTTVFTAFLTGGTIVLNFFISLIIFFTTLFYLLSSSTDRYMPLEVVGTAVKPLSNGGQIEKAIAQAVNGVFGASIKMFCFYGLYTWVNHCIFASNLVYIPSVLAALFGVIPVLSTYWVSIPSALEIWILQGSFFRAVGLIIFQFLPTLLVDAAIYGDIPHKGGGAHPYVTGLAVAGGFYTFGFEGAVVGPLVLCLLLVAGNLYTKATSSVTTS